MRCPQCREMIAEALVGELDSSTRSEFDTHVSSCEACARELGETRAALAVMDRRQRRDPGDAFWDGYWDRLQARMEEEGAEAEDHMTEQAWWRRRVGHVSPLHSWAYRGAAAAVILVLGVFVGRTFFVPQPEVPVVEVSEVTEGPAPTTVPEPRGGAATAVITSTDERAMRYVEKSQMLLLALVNTEPDADGAVADMSVQKRRSNMLVDEAEVLKDELDDPRQRRLRELVEQLEKILKEIANLESEEDVEAVEFIRSSVNRHDIMLKINLEQMRYGVREDGLRPQESGGSGQGQEQKGSI